MPEPTKLEMELLCSAPGGLRGGRDHENNHFLPPPPSISAPPAYNPRNPRIVRRGTERLHQLYETIEPKDQYRWLFRTALISFVLAVLITVAGGICVAKTPQYCSRYTAVWAGPVCAISAIIGMIAARRGYVNWFVAHLILNILSLIACLILIIFALDNWIVAANPYIPDRLITVAGPTGWQQHERGEGTHYSLIPYPCVIPEYAPRYIQFVYENFREYDFAACIERLKIGIASIAVTAFLAITEGFFAIAAGILCMMRLCVPCKHA